MLQPPSNRARENDLLGGLNSAREESLRHLGKRILFYAPSFIRYQNRYFTSTPTSFPAISITGGSCALRCAHCEGRLLASMLPALTPQRLYQICEGIKRRGGKGCLISGGCLPSGEVPLKPFLPAIARIKRELGLEVIVHTNIIDLETAEGLREAGVDAALINIVGSEETIHEVYGLPTRGIHDFRASLEALKGAGLPTIPHIVVGLHYGRLLGEFRAIDLISHLSPEALVIVAFNPIPETAMAEASPPTPRDIAKVLVYARMAMPETPQVLGCARPLGQHRMETDLLALQAGVNAIAFPSEEAIQRAESLGLKVDFSDRCCSLVYRDLES